MGKIPKGWKVTKIGVELEVILGGTPARNNASYWTNGNIPWINSSKINEFRIISPTEFITEEGLRRFSNKIDSKKSSSDCYYGCYIR